MSPRPHEGTAEEGLSSSLFQLVHEPEQLECLRSILSAFCHRCRNSLNGIKLSLYLFRREARGAVPDCWGDLEGIYQQIEQLLDHLQAIYRPMPVTVVESALAELISHHVPRWRSWYESRGRALELEPPGTEFRCEFDPAQLGAGLDAIARWRAESAGAGGLTRIAWRVVDGWVELRWGEFGGPEGGEPPEAPSARGCAERVPPSRPVDALALPLLARIVAAHGGRLCCDGGPGFGFTLRWPQYPQRNRGDGA
jgi:signal transduction histidine kinase